MTKKSKKTRAAAVAEQKTGTKAAVPNDAQVEDTLRRVFEDKYSKTYGDTDKAVHAAMNFVKDKGCCNFASLQHAAQTGMLAGTKGGTITDAALSAYTLLQMSLQESQLQSRHTPNPMVKMHTVPEDKLHNDGTSDIKGKSQTSQKSGTSEAECAMPVVRKHGSHADIDMAGGMVLFDKAKQKATAELAAEFDYADLCEQGRKLYDMVLNDKTKRIHSAMKHRAKKKGSLSPVI